MRFTGLHTKADIPSKAFKMLNRIAGGGDDVSDGPNQPQNSQQQEDGKTQDADGHFKRVIP